MDTHDQSYPSTALRAHLDHRPRELQFGTSGRRGDVVDLTQLEIYLNARAELDYLIDLPPAAGAIKPGQFFFYATDLRPSSTSFVAAQGGRGELAQAIEMAIRDAGLQPVNLGQLPTPALMAYALARDSGSMMITGSHIPFHRNGYKTNSAKGELLKADEGPINQRVAEWRERLYREDFVNSLFAANGNFKHGHRDLLPVEHAGRDAYLARHHDFLGGSALRGLRVLVYQHSAVGRDLLVETLQAVGAVAIPVGRSATFVPIDTEAIDAPTLASIQELVDDTTREHGRFDALVSTDGDSDRPLLIALEAADDAKCTARFFGGDLVGMVVAEFLNADAIVVPISCNDAIDHGPLASRVAPKTKIGSPYVVDGMKAALARGARRVCGWEANGGFLTASAIDRRGRVLSALPTRDAFLPILCVLCEMAERKISMSELFRKLPRRFSRAALLRNFPRSTSLKILAALTDAQSTDNRAPSPTLRAAIERTFSLAHGFGAVRCVDYTDGVRITFSNGDIAHVRPSGNADELRIYTVADTQARADVIAALGAQEPDGLLRQLERELATKV
ncbi:MAG: phosphomannomutase [Gammaproteobacteria bacterium]|nr:phosphomannomutase [Gammaproteobacteria bacterium]